MKLSAQNKKRAARAKKAVAAVDSYEEPTATIVDLLTDLRHLCDELELNFGQLDRTAYGHYLEERDARKISR